MTERTTEILRQAAARLGVETGYEPPTLAQIKADACRADGVLWREIALDAASCVIDREVCKAIDAAYEAGRRDEKADVSDDVALANVQWERDAAREDLAKAMAVISQHHTNLCRAGAENAGLRAEILRLRTKAPEPVKHVASPSIAARWDETPGMLKDF
jgi:hypothetical protein